jgi:hypothetical protein
MEITEIDLRLAARQIDLRGLCRDQHPWGISNWPVQMPVREPNPGDCHEKECFFHEIYNSHRLGSSFNARCRVTPSAAKGFSRENCKITSRDSSTMGCGSTESRPTNARFRQNFTGRATLLRSRFGLWFSHLFLRSREGLQLM